MGRIITFRIDGKSIAEKTNRWWKTLGVVVSLIVFGSMLTVKAGYLDQTDPEIIDLASLSTSVTAVANGYTVSGTGADRIVRIERTGYYIITGI